MENELESRVVRALQQMMLRLDRQEAEIERLDIIIQRICYFLGQAPQAIVDVLEKVEDGK